MKVLKGFAYGLALPVILVLIWWASTLGATNFFVPTPATLGETFAETWFGERIRLRRAALDRPSAGRCGGRDRDRHCARAC